MASLTIPTAGSWTITVQSGFGPSKTTMKPITVAAAGATVAAMSARSVANTSSWRRAA